MIKCLECGVICLTSNTICRCGKVKVDETYTFMTNTDQYALYLIAPVECAKCKKHTKEVRRAVLPGEMHTCLVCYACSCFLRKRDDDENASSTDDCDDDDFL